MKTKAWLMDALPLIEWIKQECNNYKSSSGFANEAIKQIQSGRFRVKEEEHK